MYLFSLHKKQVQRELNVVSKAVKRISAKRPIKVDMNRLVK